MPSTPLRMLTVLTFAISIGAPGISLAQQPSRSATVRRGAPGANVPMTDVSITLGRQTTTGRVDANCHTLMKKRRPPTRAPIS